MLDNLRLELASDHGRLHLLRHSALDKLAILASLVRERNVEARRLARDDLDAQALLAQVDLPNVRVINEDGRDQPEDLDGERGRRGDGQSRDCAVEQD